MTRQDEARQRLLLLKEASTRIGDTLDTVRTAQELTEVAVDRLADFAVVELLPSIDSGASRRPERRPPHHAAPGGLPLGVRGRPETAVPIGYLGTYPRGSAVTECMVTGRGR
ncbi:hypothetical protein NKH77_09315 [Streptomyces sp. M19]